MYEPFLPGWALSLSYRASRCSGVGLSPQKTSQAFAGRRDRHLQLLAERDVHVVQLLEALRVLGADAGGAEQDGLRAVLPDQVVEEPGVLGEALRLRVVDVLEDDVVPLLLGDLPARCPCRARAVPPCDGRRVPGHEPGPTGADRPAAGRRDEGVHRGRRAPIDLSVPERRPRGLSRGAPARGGFPDHRRAAAARELSRPSRSARCRERARRNAPQRIHAAHRGQGERRRGHAPGRAAADARGGSRPRPPQVEGRGHRAGSPAFREGLGDGRAGPSAGGAPARAGRYRRSAAR